MAKRGAGPCGMCRSARVVPIRYGFPGPEMIAEADRGELELGGCVVFDDAPERRCRACGATWSPRGGWSAPAAGGGGPGNPDAGA